MTAEELVVARLGATPSVTGLVGARIYPMQMPQGTVLPAVTYQRISTVRAQGFAGSLGLADPRIQIDAWAETYPVAKALGHAVRQALDGYTAPGVAALILDERDLIDAEGRRHRVSQDFSLWVDEA